MCIRDRLNNLYLSLYGALLPKVDKPRVTPSFPTIPLHPEGLEASTDIFKLLIPVLFF